MARIRTIKPDFWKHEELSELPCETHLLAAALLNYADDEGYFRANPKLVKAECCPLREDSVSVHDSLNQLAQVGYVRLFTGTDGKRYGHIRNFLSHQHISRPSASKISPLDDGSECSMNAHGGLSEGSLPEGKGREQGTGNGREEEGSRSDAGASVPSQSDDVSVVDLSQRQNPSDIAKQMVQIWHEECGDVLPRVDKLNQKRIKSASARFHDELERDFEKWRAVCQQVRGSPFLRGEEGRDSWRGASFDWCLTPTYLPKIMEGHYDPKPAGNAEQQQPANKALAAFARYRATAGSG
jgi:hypothetical protein